MSLSQSVSIIMGANIGSTVTAQILAFNIAYYALIPVAVGFFMSFSGKTERAKYFGMMLMGLGLVFYGMGLMSDGMKPLRSYEPFMEILGKMELPLYGILAGQYLPAWCNHRPPRSESPLPWPAKAFLPYPLELPWRWAPILVPV